MDAIKQILRKGEELLSGRRKKRIFKEIIVNAEALENRVAVLEDGQLEEFSIERTTESRIVASVFRTEIKNLEPGLKAAFVDIGFEKNAFLHYWDIIPEQLDQRVDLLERRKADPADAKPKISQKDIPQLYPPADRKSSCRSSKGPIGTKGPRIHNQYKHSRSYLVLMPFNAQRGMLAQDRRRERAPAPEKNLAAPAHPTKGWASSSAPSARIRRSDTSSGTSNSCCKRGSRSREKDQDPDCRRTCVFQEPDLVERTVRDFLTEEVDRIVVDNDRRNERIRSMIGQITAALARQSAALQ